MRAQREWHIETRFGRFYVVNQYGGFEGWHTDLESALAQGRQHVKDNPGDSFAFGSAVTV